MIYNLLQDLEKYKNVLLFKNILCKYHPSKYNRQPIYYVYFLNLINILVLITNIYSIFFKISKKRGF
jgi:hypothetical protein